MVILVKKLAHVALEKFCAMLPSKGCGNGVGSVGGALGTTGTGWLEIGIRDDELAGDAVVVDETDGEAESDAWGSGLRLWALQLDPRSGDSSRNDS